MTLARSAGIQQQQCVLVLDENKTRLNLVHSSIIVALYFGQPVNKIFQQLNMHDMNVLINACQDCRKESLSLIHSGQTQSGHCWVRTSEAFEVVWVIFGTCTCTKSLCLTQIGLPWPTCYSFCPPCHNMVDILSNLDQKPSWGM